MAGVDASTSRTKRNAEQQQRVNKRAVSLGIVSWQATSDSNSQSDQRQSLQEQQLQHHILRRVVRSAAQQLLCQQIDFHYKLVNKSLDRLACYHLYSVLLESVLLCADQSVTMSALSGDQKTTTTTKVSNHSGLPVRVLSARPLQQQQQQQQQQQNLQRHQTSICIFSRPSANGSRIPVPIRRLPAASAAKTGIADR
ncbi:hypothetical protein BOX15_Mlig000961g3 [Macrostomum lignano]|uniref:Uncharacterized protein n=1 Tax=Macrostomum lignano TaxID=282301 RepID=A0A267DMV6_9PLAT|nr:hypothetical protein BOX15_Mlig000961g3 [Macrostomum lignano]